ncbi:hypothetical protein BDN71DRAFT_1274106 [Pleurotus eryngii]|uniref:Uncharacterized protein n=1 Tax=Pleurotus eryngii TaxID=5323 RepID=A0A9P5ZP77_PLEER|nr:hypothetical protein BDN71DRAFT_1274106 [Pleurotus eryngii]
MPRQSNCDPAYLYVLQSHGEHPLHEDERSSRLRRTHCFIFTPSQSSDHQFLSVSVILTARRSGHTDRAVTIDWCSFETPVVSDLRSFLQTFGFGSKRALRRIWNRPPQGVKKIVRCISEDCQIHPTYDMLASCGSIPQDLFHTTQLTMQAYPASAGSLGERRWRCRSHWILSY